MRCGPSDSGILSGNLCSSSTGKRSASSPARGEPRRKLIRHRDPRVYFPASSEAATKTRISESVSGDVSDSPVRETALSSGTVTIISPVAVSTEPGNLRDESMVSGPELTVQEGTLTGGAVESSGISMDQSIDLLGNEAVFSGRMEAIALSDPQPGLEGERGMENLLVKVR